jgi:hypothetical protein
MAFQFVGIIINFRQGGSMEKDILGLPDSRKFTKEELEAISREYEESSSIGEAIEKVIGELKQALSEHRVPSPIVVAKSAWFPTNTWELVSLDLDRFKCTITLTLYWMANDGLTDLNPMYDRPGRPAGFGPGFELPHTFSKSFRLTEMPTNSGWSTGFEQGIPGKHLEAFRVKLAEEINKLEWIKKEP